VVDTVGFITISGMAKALPTCKKVSKLTVDQDLNTNLSYQYHPTLEVSTLLCFCFINAYQ
jgi:hypothetical protein